MLLSRRAGTVHATGHWHFPSGHVDGPFEDVVTALVRETNEETGLVVDPDDVRAAVTVHHRAPAGSAGRFLLRGPPLVRDAGRQGAQGVRRHGLVCVRRSAGADGRLLPRGAGGLSGWRSRGAALPGAGRSDRARPGCRPDPPCARPGPR
ncbi:NUDIX domain-containing protein [Streptomyces atroolivaceus]|uniref:NUDIX domain-containing protein n=1 Tax=Streptomyces atroolivaceus TaxID=66869 RepID=UPI001FCA9D5E|nr:NUDIX domain-containing protein [Streptomyces atroolivaceus]